MFIKYQESEIDIQNDNFESSNPTKNATKCQLNDTDIRNEIDEKIHNPGMEGSSWKSQHIMFLEKEIQKTKGVVDNSIVELPIRSSSFPNIQNDDKSCFVCSFWRCYIQSIRIHKEFLNTNSVLIN